MSIANSIRKLREANHLSQTEFAETFKVSPQAVQKWEQGASHPSIPNLIAIGKHFNVSIDSLLLESSGRIVEEMRAAKKVFPDFEGIHEWEAYSKNLELEYRQSTEEGYDLTPWREMMTAVSKLPDCREKDQFADILFQAVINAERMPKYGYQEPSELSAIKALRKEQLIDRRPVSDAVLKEKIRGAWLGRIIGCLLGKPIEGIRTNELLPLLKESNNYPMYRYIVSDDITEEMCDRFSFRLKGKCWADTISAAPVDDDTNYTVFAQLLIDRYGREFTPADVGHLWLSSQAKDAYCTAERVAFRNLVNGYAPPASAIYKNPYREWIGAQIRGDYFGYINPGDPETAADMAWRDASISHVKNGIYGEMFAAAMTACAAVCEKTEDIILGGLSQVPSTSRLYEAIEDILNQYRNGVPEDKVFKYIHTQWDEFNQHDWCHTISNAMIVAAALLYGRGDFGKSICLAVQTGFDTDCNGATVGSIVGMQKGAAVIEERWVKPLHGKLETSIFGVGTVAVDQLVEKTMEHMIS